MAGVVLVACVAFMGLLLLCATAVLARGQECGTRRVFFVAPGGTGDGRAPHAAASLESILAAGLNASSHLKLLEGTHVTTKTFVLMDDVRVEGGFVRSFDPLLPPSASWVDWAKVAPVILCVFVVVSLVLEATSPSSGVV
jgi:hypothetical protein